MKTLIVLGGFALLFSVSPARGDSLHRVARTSQPICLDDIECPSGKLCDEEGERGTCWNPCLPKFGTCGENADCEIRQTETEPIIRLPVCSCQEGYVGDPYARCDLQDSTRATEPKTCSRDGECPDGEVCGRESGACYDICARDNPCGQDAVCEVRPRPFKPSSRIAVCECPSGVKGDPYVRCKVQDTPEECERDLECPSDLKCLADSALIQRCLDPCAAEQNECGPNAACSVAPGDERRTVCSCDRGFIGNPYIRCDADTTAALTDSRLAAESNPEIECFTPEGKCDLPCDEEENPCGDKASCSLVAFSEEPGETERLMVCACDRGFHGDPYDECTPDPNFKLDDDSGDLGECGKDDDCQDDEACLEGKCGDPCEAVKPCAARNAVCSVAPTSPVRTMVCACEAGYEGRGDVECTRKKPSRCSFRRGSTPSLKYFTGIKKSTDTWQECASFCDETEECTRWTWIAQSVSKHGIRLTFGKFAKHTCALMKGEAHKGYIRSYGVVSGRKVCDN